MPFGNQRLAESEGETKKMKMSEEDGSYELKKTYRTTQKQIIGALTSC